MEGVPSGGSTHTRGKPPLTLGGSSVGKNFDGSISQNFSGANRECKKVLGEKSIAKVVRSAER